MTKKKPQDSKTAPKPSESPTTVIGAKRIKKNYQLGDDYRAWKEHCDSLKTQSAFHSSEATRFRNAYKKTYENGAEGFCADCDEKEWEKANNLITIAAMKEDERANAWKDFPISKLDIPRALLLLVERNFGTLGPLAEWVNKDYRDKIKKLGDKAVETLRDALNKVIAPYHEPIIQAEVERAKAFVQSLSK